MRRFSISFSLLVIATLAASSADASVVIFNNRVTAEVDGGMVDELEYEMPPLPFPLSETLESVNATSVSNVAVDYYEAGGITVLDNVFSFSRGGDIDDFSRIEQPFLTFAVTADTTYSLMGNISAVDGNPLNPGTVWLGASLTDMFFTDTDPNYTLFRNLQYSANTVNESLTLGNTAGDVAVEGNNVLAGSLTGMLLAGHTYRWEFTSHIDATPDSDGGATANGRLKLVIGGDISGDPEVEPVPEPSALLTLSGLALCFGLGSWRKRRKQAA